MSSALSIVVLELGVSLVCLVLLFGCRRNSRELAAARWMEVLLAAGATFFLLDGMLWALTLFDFLQNERAFQYVVNTIIFVDGIALPWAFLGLVHALNDPAFTIKSRTGIIEATIAIAFAIATVYECATKQLFVIPEAGQYATGDHYVIYGWALVAFALVASVLAGVYAIRNEKQRKPLIAMALLPFVELAAVSFNLVTDGVMGVIVAVTIISILTYAGVILEQAAELENRKHEAQRRVTQLNEEESQWRIAQVRTQFDADETLRVLEEAEKLCDTDPLAASEAIEQLAATLRKKADAARRQTSE